jgi:hypothetical protein
VSAKTEAAKKDFTEAMKDSGHLMALHTRTNPGRRHHEPSLNRAVAVMTAAAWQSYVQDTTRAILDYLAVPPRHPGKPQFDLIKASTMTALGRFNTPNARNTLALFQHVGFDPRSGWSFSVSSRPHPYSSQGIEDEIEEWLKIRHTIAHGALLPAVAVVSGRTQRGPKLWKADAEHCISFFGGVVAATAAEAHRLFP